MIKNSICIFLTTCGFLLSSTSLSATAKTNQSVDKNSNNFTAEENYTTVQNLSETTFVCAVAAKTPTMYAYHPGNVNLTPLMSWYSEYLLPQQSGKQVCQQTATKLQALSQQSEKRYFRTENKEDKTVVCLVADKEETCDSENSEALFSLNPNYDAGCVLDNKEPIECVAVGKVRGVFAVPDSPYQPSWWPW
jgi:hypothetical protein